MLPAQVQQLGDKVKQSMQWLGALLGFISVTAISNVDAGLVGTPFKITNASSSGLFWALSATNGETAAVYTASSALNLRRYSANGTDLTATDFYLSTSSDSTAALMKNGNYIVARMAADGSGQGIFATVYNRSGAVVLPEFRVNAATAGDQIGPQVAADGSGGFAVAWLNSGTQHVYIKRFTASGAVALSDVDINAGQTGVASIGPIAMDASGNLIASWIWNTQSGANGIDVWIRRYPITGSPSSATRANVYTTSTQAGVKLAMNSWGDTVVIWESYGQDGSDYGIYGRRYSPSFSPLGVEFRVNTTTSGRQTFVGVGVADDGSFIVSWLNDNRIVVPSSIPDVRYQQFTAAGVAHGSEVTIPNPTGLRGGYTGAATDPAGNALVAWSAVDQTTGYGQAYAQRVKLDTLPSAMALTSGQSISGLGGAIGTFAYYRLFVPVGTTTMSINLTGPAGGDANLYIRAGALPTSTRWDIRPQTVGNNETVTISNPPAGEMYVGIYGQSAYSGVSLVATNY